MSHSKTAWLVAVHVANRDTVFSFPTRTAARNFIKRRAMSKDPRKPTFKIQQIKVKTNA